MSHYMLMLHDVPADYAHLGRVELSQLVQKYVDWVEDLKKSGRYVASFKLAPEGRRIGVDSSAPVPSDGPYAEAKDVIGGAFVIEAESLGAAEAVARTSPHLHGRNTIEIRMVDEESCHQIIAEGRAAAVSVPA